MKIQECYKELRKVHLTKSGYHFSRHFLGKNRSYYSVLVARDSEPSIEAMTTLYYSLTHQSSLLESSDSAFIIRARNKVNELKISVSNDIQTHCYQSIGVFE